MKVLVIGSGGREHALCWKLAQSPLADEILCAPGNAGTATVARNVDVAVTNVSGLVELARSEGVGLAIVGPEDPLVAGVADALREAGIDTFGPNAAGARLEGSKAFAKEFLGRHRIPTAGYRRFDRSGAAKSYLEGCKEWPQVIKADGLAAGKGVFVTHDAVEGCSVVDRIMEERSLGEAGDSLIIEECLFGDEVSVLAITDGEALLVLEPVMDHKQVGEGDTGANTGGMGVVSPVEQLSKRLQRQIEQHVLIPTLHGLRRDEIDFRGVLFVGLMLTEAGPRVLEYNCRFGDPEIQAVMRRMQSDLLPYLLAAAQGKLADMEGPEWDPRTCIGVVAASEGYPGSYRKGDVIEGLDQAELSPEVVVFHAGTAETDKAVVTAGGRVLCVTSLGEDLEEARARAYQGCDAIRWDGKFCRRDIGLPRPKRAPEGAPETSSGAADPRTSTA